MTAAKDTPQTGPEGAEATARVPAPASSPPSGPLSADEERQLGKLLERRAAAQRGEHVQLKVEEPHTSLTFGGVTVTTDPTPVPAARVPDFMQAAAEAGVTVTRQEE